MLIGAYRTVTMLIPLFAVSLCDMMKTGEGNRIPEDTSHSSTTGVTLPNPVDMKPSPLRRASTVSSKKKKPEASPVAMHLVHRVKTGLNGLFKRSFRPQLRLKLKTCKPFRPFKRVQM